MHLRPHLAIESIEVFEQKSLRQLSSAIGPEVKEKDRVAVADPLFVRVQRKSAGA